MSDERVGALERRAAQGDPEARAFLLREQVRAQALPRLRVELAAILGDPVARAALGPDAPPEVHLTSWRDLQTWIEGPLADYGRMPAQVADWTAAYTLTYSDLDRTKDEAELCRRAWAAIRAEIVPWALGEA